MEVRRAQATDIGRINELLSQVDMVHHVGRPDLFKIGRKYTDSQLLDIISDDARPVFVAADDDGNVLGHAFCVFKQYLNNNIMTDIKTLYIDDICVDEKSRGQHVGTALYDFVINFAKENSCYNVTLNVWNCNKSAMKFYQALGLVPQKTGMEKIL
jgi:ribosomal protein S18 acetylase RimI-like enzyme